MRGLNIGVNTYNALIQSATLCHPYGVRIYFAYFPGFRRRRGSTPGLFYGALTGSKIRLAYGNEKVRLFVTAARCCRCRVAILWLR